MLDELPARRLYTLFAARAAVFVVEQNCPYQDLDGADLEAEHLIAWSGDEVAACLRLLAPGVKYAEAFDRTRAHGAGVSHQRARP